MEEMPYSSVPGDVVAVQFHDPARGLLGAFQVEEPGAEDVLERHPSVDGRDGRAAGLRRVSAARGRSAVGACRPGRAC